MIIHSPTGSLIQVLQNVLLSSDLYRDKLTKNEAATRAVLIDPVLSALGWDSTNLHMIEYELFFVDTKVDYALYDCNKKLQVIVEAKALGVNISDIRFTSKIMSYCLVHGVPNVFLTDGIVWQHYNQFTPGGLSPASFEISSGSVVEFAQYLLQNLDAIRYWPPQPAPPVASALAFDMKINALETKIAALQAKLESIQAPQVIPPAPVTTYTWVPLESLTGDLTGKKPPALLKLPDGKQVSIKTWRDILAACCRYVLANHPNLSIPLIDSAGRTRPIFSYEPPGYAASLDEVTYNGRKVLVYLNYSAAQSVKNAIYILGYLPKGIPNRAEVTYDQPEVALVE